MSGAELRALHKHSSPHVSPKLSSLIGVGRLEVVALRVWAVLQSWDWGLGVLGLCGVLVGGMGRRRVVLLSGSQAGGL